MFYLLNANVVQLNLQKRFTSDVRRQLRGEHQDAESIKRQKAVKLRARASNLVGPKFKHLTLGTEFWQSTCN